MLLGCGRVLFQRRSSLAISCQQFNPTMQLSRADELFDIQAVLWRTIGLDASARPAELQRTDLDSCLSAARAICLQSAELKQLLCPEDIQRPLNPRNEAAALALLLANKQSVCGSCPAREQQLQALLAAYPGSLMCAGIQQGAAGHTQQQTQELQEFQPESPEGLLYASALQQGVQSKVTPALFPCTTSSTSGSANTSGSSADTSSSNRGSSRSAAVLRGCAAAADLEAGSVVMSVPAQLLITYTTAAESDFGKALSRLPGLDPETLAVIWTMVDRHEPESPHALFWAALPAHFGTGLSVPQGLVDLLKGVPVYEEVMQARSHVRQQFQALLQTFQVLLTAYSSYLQPSWFTEEAYLWAVELWYAYAIQVKFPDGTIKPALVPLASLINHSASPHVVHFSTVNPKTRCLELKSFRPVSQHHEVFLSYGPLPNSQLLLFYGFALPGNPFEQLQLELQPERVWQLLQQHGSKVQEGEQKPQQQGEHANHHGDVKVQLLQELQLPLSFTLTVQQPLPAECLQCLRVLCADEHELHELQEAVAGFKQKAEAVPAAAASGIGGGTGSTKAKGKTSTTGTAYGSSSGHKGGSSGAAGILGRWAAAAQRSSMLGSPISSRNETAVRAVLQELLGTAREPYELCLAKLGKRQQLLALLQRPQQPAEEGFMHTLEGYLHGVLSLLNASSTMVGQLSCS